MVAERCLSASLLEIVSSSPRLAMAQMDAIIANMAAHEDFVPTHIASAGEGIGPVLLQITCKVLLAREVLMSLGGYIVKGVALACGRRARAIRNGDGTYSVVRPGHFSMAIADLPQPQAQQQPPPLLPLADDTAAASSIYLAIQENTPSPSGSLLPQLEEQAAVEQPTVDLQSSRCRSGCRSLSPKRSSPPTTSSSRTT